MTHRTKTAAQLRKGEVITAYPFHDSKRHEFGAPVRWAIVDHPHPHMDVLVLDCRDEIDGGQVAVEIGRHMDVTVETAEPRPDPDTGAAVLMWGQLGALCQRLDTMRHFVDGPQIAALIRTQMDTARTESRR